MKNKIHSVCLTLLALLVLGCEQPTMETETDAEERTEGNVTLKVEGFERYEGEGATREVRDVTEVCSRLNFIVYQNDAKVKAVNQTKDSKDFGKVSLTLPTGTYQVLVLAHSCAANPSQAHAEKIGFTNKSGFTDTFYHYGDLTVDADGATMAMSLKRATACFRLVTTDAKPSDVKRMRLYYTGGSGTLNAVTGYGCVKSKQYIIYNVGEETGGLTLEAYTFLHDEEGQLNITVSAYDANENTLYEKELTDVPMKRNTITEYRGNLFDGSPLTPSPEPETPDNPDTPDEPDTDPTGGYTFTVDDAWAEVNVITF